jgi:hypothetical protein
MKIKVAMPDASVWFFHAFGDDNGARELSGLGERGSEHDSILKAFVVTANAPLYNPIYEGVPFMADNQNLNSSELTGILVETKTEFQDYQVTDCQISSTSSLQAEYLSGKDSILTL